MTIDFELNEISVIADSILKQKQYAVIIFNGPMGAGKTTLIKVLCQKLGVQNPTSSPTFSLVNEYDAGLDKIYHFDMYRLKHESEAFDFGIEDYLYSGNICFIEWAEKIPHLLPENYHIINLEILTSGLRRLKMTSN